MAAITRPLGAYGRDAGFVPRDAWRIEMLSDAWVDLGDLSRFFVRCHADFLLCVEAQAHGHFVAQTEQISGLREAYREGVRQNHRDGFGVGAAFQ